MGSAGPLISLLRYHVEQLDLDRIGLGADEYHPEMLEHPAAYAFYARGLATLGAVDPSGPWCDLAARTADRLVSIKSPHAEVAWGLPFVWQPLPRDFPNTYTTAVAALALADVERVNSSPVRRDCVNEACRWLIETPEWHEVAEGAAAPAYAPGWNYVATNVAALVAAALYRGQEITGDARFRSHADEAVAFVEARQRDRGYWAYADEDRQDDTERYGTRVVDLVHSAYTLDGLVAALAAGSGEDRDRRGAVIARAVGFLTEYLIDFDGWAREKVMVLPSADPELARLTANPQLTGIPLDEQHVLVSFPVESRAWGYGALLGALGRAAAARAVGFDVSMQVMRHVLRELAGSPTGRFPYRPGDPRRFPRHEAHVFDGIAAVAAAIAAPRRS